MTKGTFCAKLFSEQNVLKSNSLCIQVRTAYIGVPWIIFIRVLGVIILKNLYEKFKPVFIVVIAVLAVLSLILIAFLNWGFFTSGTFKFEKLDLEVKPFGALEYKVDNAVHNGSWEPYEKNMFVNKGLYVIKLEDGTQKLVAREGNAFAEKWICDLCGGVNNIQSKECKNHLFCPDCNKMYTDNINMDYIKKVGACEACVKATVLTGKWEVENLEYLALGKTYFEFMYDGTWKCSFDNMKMSDVAGSTWSLSDGALTLTQNVVASEWEQITVLFTFPFMAESDNTEYDDTEMKQYTGTCNVKIIDENTIEIQGFISEQETTTLKLVSRK